MTSFICAQSNFLLGLLQFNQPAYMTAGQYGNQPWTSQKRFQQYCVYHKLGCIKTNAWFPE